MSKADVERLHQASVDALNAHDAKGYAAFFADDALYVVYGVREFRGAEQIEALWRRGLSAPYTVKTVAAMFDDEHFFVDYDITTTDTVGRSLPGGGTAPPTGKSARYNAMARGRVRSGKIVEFYTAVNYQDRDRQLGWIQ